MTSGARVLVTGGCGFIGVNLGRMLAERGWTAVAYDSLVTGKRADAEAAGMELIVGDVRDRDSLTEAMRGADYVVHLAARTNVIESIEDPVGDVSVNVEGTLNALLAARDNDVAGFVFASSNAPLGDIEPPSNERAVPAPVSPYGASKLAGEGLCSAFAGSYGLPATVLRFSNVYGPFSYHKGSVVAKFLKHVMADEPLTIFGDGNQTRDFVHVNDLCAGIVSAVSSGLHGETFHLGSGVETTLLDLTDRLVALFPDREIPVIHEPSRPGEILRNYSDISKARSMLGFDPVYDLDRGLQSTRQWFEEAYGS